MSETEEKKYGSWKELIETATVRDLILETHSKQLITLDPKISISKAVDILNEAKILSAPVIDREHHSILGLVDSSDIMAFIVSHWRRSSFKLDLGSFPPSDFFSHPVSEVINFSKRDYPKSIPDSATVRELIDLFVNVRPSEIIHRVFVIHGVGQLLATVSQSDLVKFLARHIDLVKTDQTITELGLSHLVVIAKENEPVSRVLELMLDHRISGVALVDSQGHLTGNLSVSDFRGFKPTSVDYFLSSAKQFVGKNVETTAPVAVFSTSTFKQLIARILHHHVHRVFVITEENYPVGIITLTDIVRYISELSK